MQHRKGYFVLALALLGLLFGAAALAEGDGVETRRALLIGNVEYKHMNRLPPSKSDIAHMQTLFAAMKHDGLPYARIDSHFDQTNEQMRALLRGLQSWGADADDVTVIYYSGHGDTVKPEVYTSDTTGLCGIDTDDKEHPLLVFSEMEKILREVPGTVVLLLDSCHSGGAIEKRFPAYQRAAVAAFAAAPKASFASGKYKVVAGCKKDSISLGSFLSGAYGGVLTTYLAGGAGLNFSANRMLAEAPADENGDGVVTLAEDYAYTVREVAKTSTQKPQVYPENSAFALFARTEAKIAALTPRKARLYENGETAQLRCALAPAQAKSPVQWTSSDEDVATVDANGLVTAVGIGSCQIVAASGKSSRAATILVKRRKLQDIALEAEEIEIRLNERRRIAVLYTPAETTQREIVWKSSRPGVASVDETGLIRARRLGSAVVSATAENGVKRAVKVTVVDPTALADFTLSSASLTLPVGFGKRLTATFVPANASNRALAWTSDKPAVATVKNGKITALAPGRATITARSRNGLTRTCQVTVAANEYTFTDYLKKDPQDWDAHTPEDQAIDRIKVAAARLYYQGDDLCCDFIAAYTGGDATHFESLDNLVVYVCEWGEKPVDPLKRVSLNFHYARQVNFDAPLTKDNRARFTMRMPRSKIGLLDLRKGGYKAFLSAFSYQSE